MDLWRFSPGDGMLNSLIASAVKTPKPSDDSTVTKLTLTVVKPGERWTSSENVPFSIQQLQSVFPKTPKIPWRNDFEYAETNGVFRAMRSIALPKLHIKLYWAVVHIKTTAENGETSYKIMDRFWCSTTN